MIGAMSGCGTFRSDTPGQRCPLIGEEQKFAARCQSDAIDPERTSTARWYHPMLMGQDQTGR
jgi:hypothetical protein